MRCSNRQSQDSAACEPSARRTTRIPIPSHLGQGRGMNSEYGRREAVYIKAYLA